MRGLTVSPHDPFSRVFALEHFLQALRQSLALPAPQEDVQKS